MDKLPIGLACDHAGFETKQFIIELLKNKGIEFKDFGCSSTEACDYADPAHELGYAVEYKEVYHRIAI